MLLSEVDFRFLQLIATTIRITYAHEPTFDFAVSMAGI